MITVTHLKPEHLAHLASVVGDENLSTVPADLDQHARDQSFHEARRPAAVVWPGSTQEVSQVLRYADQQRIPVTPWGAGTSLEGNPIPLYGGLSLDMRRMNSILKVRPEDFQVEVQPGMLYKDMNASLARHGLFFAPDPGANASIGGMVANNAAGTRTLRYGTTKDNVLRLEVVLASGEVLRTGTHASKTSSGYDLVHLFVGSEGTLGVVTEATLRLAPLPEQFSAAIASFAAPADATRAVTAVMGAGMVPAALEFLDLATVEALNESGEFELPQHPTLLMEFHSASQAALKEELSLVQQLCRGEGCLTFEGGLGRAERDRLWRARHQTYEILVRRRPGSAYLIVDVAVPVSHYPELVAEAARAMSEGGLEGYLVGHAGDGNLHPLIPYEPGDEASYAEAMAAEEAIVEAAISMDGTATGEHGVGIGKRTFMAREHGAGLQVMRAIKAALDPNGILNPGKVFEADGSS
ncbi:MAG: FAD-binding oxidoreductase [Anaerolineae bacterium]|nr:MAG: FAD-binding oxidoreductase [Anaerolineae bacterium]